MNGGGGVMFNDDPCVATLRTIAEAHRRTGTRALLPTLITDTPGCTAAAVEAAVGAIDEGVPGIVGIHLEGPHLSRGRKGAHDAALIRPPRKPPGDRVVAGRPTTTLQQPAIDRKAHIPEIKIGKDLPDSFCIQQDCVISLIDHCIATTRKSVTLAVGMEKVDQTPLRMHDVVIQLLLHPLP